VLSRDIFQGEPEDILKTQADLVLRGGEAVFDRHGVLD
jgi:hypothetical protein